MFFNNTECLNCRRQLGIDPRRGHVLALDPGKAPDTCLEAGRPRRRPVQRSSNLASPPACNLRLPAAAAH
ncbi:hypothetical protein HGQ98_20135, partial [Achromobacter ruhlandii]|nr:hypothetical protein [Achromobacter ruhlandii]